MYALSNYVQTPANRVIDTIENVSDAQLLITLDSGFMNTRDC